MSGIVIDGSLLQRLLALRIYLIDCQRQPCTTQVIEIFVIEQFDIEFFNAFAGTGENNAVIGQRIGTYGRHHPFVPIENMEIHTGNRQRVGSREFVLRRFHNSHLRKKIRGITYIKTHLDVVIALGLRHEFDGQLDQLGTGTVDGDRPVRERRIALIVGLVIESRIILTVIAVRIVFIIVFAGGAMAANSENMLFFI